MSVTDILKQIGKPTETSKLVKTLNKEIGISDRQAYRLITKAWKSKEIRKVTLPDRSILCLLPEWTLPGSTTKPKEILNFRDAFKYRCFKNLEEISSENVDGDSLTAYLYLRHLVKMLPHPLKMQVTPDLNEVDVKLRKIKEVDKYTTQRSRQNISRVLNEMLIDKISSLLHEW